MGKAINIRHVTKEVEEEIFVAKFDAIPGIRKHFEQTGCLAMTCLVSYHHEDG